MNGYFCNLGSVINLNNVDKLVIERSGYEDLSYITFDFYFFSGNKSKEIASNLNIACGFLSSILNITKQEAKSIICAIPVQNPALVSQQSSEEKK